MREQFLFYKNSIFHCCTADFVLAFVIYNNLQMQEKNHLNHKSCYRFQKVVLNENTLFFDDVNIACF